MTDTPADDLVERLRNMASAWKRWGADGIFRGALHSDIVNEAASEIARLQQELEEAEAARDGAIDRAAFRARVYLMGCGLHYETADGATRAVLNLKEDAGAKDDWLEKVDDSTVRIGPAVIARAAIIAFLDTEGMKTAVLRAIADALHHNLTLGDVTNAALSALRAEAGGDTKP